MFTISIMYKDDFIKKMQFATRELADKEMHQVRKSMENPNTTIKNACLHFDGRVLDYCGNFK